MLFQFFNYFFYRDDEENNRQAAEGENRVYQTASSTPRM